MPFELSTALKYLLPRMRRLSVSTISVISMVVISLVVWLVVVFFSVISGLEKQWVEKLIAVTAPVQIRPTPAYYQSYFHRIDEISANAGYTTKSLQEKATTLQQDPYDPEVDQEIPEDWPIPLRNNRGELRNLVRDAMDVAKEVGYEMNVNIAVTPYQAGFGRLQLELQRQKDGEGEWQSGYLTQPVVVSPAHPQSPYLAKTVVEPLGSDISHLLHVAQKEQIPEILESWEPKKLTAPEWGWAIPKTMLPEDATWEAVTLHPSNGSSYTMVGEKASDAEKLRDELEQKGISATCCRVHVDKNSSLHVAPGAKIEISGWEIGQRDEPVAHIAMRLQGTSLQGSTPLKGLEITAVEQKSSCPLCPDKYSLTLPTDSRLGAPLLVPKVFRQANVRIGDQGHIHYQGASATIVQEQRIPVFVAGFYDPGIIPMGGRVILTNPYVADSLAQAMPMSDNNQTSSLHVYLPDSKKAVAVADRVREELKERGLSSYWEVQDYSQYEHAQNILRQLQSDKTIFLLVATVIIIVACSNIISMLIILVRDKKVEIGILRSMGASKSSIAAIFGLCGSIMGLVGSLAGVLLATFTLHHIDGLLALLGKLQGHEMLNPIFYGESIPQTLHPTAVLFVLGVTGLFSLVAAVIPAMQASSVNPSEVLRGQG